MFTKEKIAQKGKNSDRGCVLEGFGLTYKDSNTEGRVEQKGHPHQPYWEPSLKGTFRQVD